MNQRWLNWLERRFHWLAMPGLASFIVGMNAMVWVLTMIKPGFQMMLDLDPALIAHGQVWRVFTFLFIPPEMSPLWMFFWLYLLFIYAQALEHEWGDFRFNVFYGIGAVCTVAASLFFGEGLSNVTLNLTIFLAFANLYPDFELLLFFILPVKVKWLAYLAWAGIAWHFFTGGTYARIALGSELVNYVVFFGPAHWESWRLRLQTWRNRRRFK